MTNEEAAEIRAGMREISNKIDSYAVKMATIDGRETTHEAVCAERYEMILQKIRWLFCSVMFLTGVELFGGHRMIELLASHLVLLGK